MTPIHLIFMFLSVLLVCETQARPIIKQATVAASGETTLTARTSKLDVQVLIRTRLANGADHFDMPGYVEHSHVERIDIVVGGKPIWVHRSAFCDLFDVLSAEVRLEEGRGILVFEGGDASESYWVKIEFNAAQVKRRLLGSSMTPGKASIVTTYKMSVLEDE